MADRLSFSFFFFGFVFFFFFGPRSFFLSRTSETTGRGRLSLTTAPAFPSGAYARPVPGECDFRRFLPFGGDECVLNAPSALRRICFLTGGRAVFISICKSLDFSAAIVLGR